MTTDTLDKPQMVASINGRGQTVNTKEIENFLKQCETFMSADRAGFETMIQIISDNLIDGASAETTMEELKPQLKFLREVGFLIRSFSSGY